jgi:large subunit ribosomal protein L15
MVHAGLISNKNLEVKVLGTGKLTKPLIVRAHRFSESAKAALEAAGGKAEVI